MQKKQLTQLATNILMAFVLVSIGFSLGKHYAKARLSPIATDEFKASNDSHVAVYYMHSTFRCETCNTIQSMAYDLLNKSYSRQLANGQIQWLEVDFQEQEALANRFEVSASCVVVARMDKGDFLEFQRLDEVWTKMKDPILFNQYVSEPIDIYLKKGGLE